MSRILLALACAGLLAAAMDAALAQNSTSGGTGSNTGGTGSGGNETLAQWEKARYQNFSKFRREALESFAENRTLLRAEFEDNMSHVRVAFFDGKLQAMLDCRAQAAGWPPNASGPHSGVYASCMAGKMPGLRQAAQQARQQNVTQWSQSIAAQRDLDKQMFQQERDAWLATNPRPG